MNELLLVLLVVAASVTDEATLRNLLRHQEKNLQGMLKERDELRQQAERQQKEIERQQREIDDLKQLRREEALGAPHGSREGRQKLRKQVTIQLADADESNTPWRQQQQQGPYQGGERGELHGRADGGDNSAAATALQLSAINAGNAEGAPLEGAPVDSPPAAGRLDARRPIEMVWVDVQLRYEAFLMSLRSLPLSSLTSEAPGQRQQREELKGAAETPLAASALSVLSRPLKALRSDTDLKELQWADSSCMASLAAAIDAVADAAMPSFLSRCCRLAAAAASPSSQRRPQPARASRQSRMSVQQVQDRILMSKRQQHQQQQDEASGKPLGPLDWGESDLQVLAYELLLLVIHHYSQYAAAASLLTDEDEVLRLACASWPTDTRGQPQQDLEQQQQLQQAAANNSARQVHRSRRSLGRAMSFKRSPNEEEEEKQQQQLLQVIDAAAEADAAGGQAAHETQPSTATTPSRPSVRPRKSLARAMSFKLPAFHGDEEVVQQQQQQLGLNPFEKENPSGWGSAPENVPADLAGPCHPFSFPLEEWERRLRGENKGLSSSFTRPVVPLQRRLQAANQWLSPSPMLQQSNEEVLLQLLQLARVCFELPSASSNKLLSLLIPAADSGLGLGEVYTTLHPCDLRFRVSRLMDAWRVALWPAASSSKAAPAKKQEQQKPRQQQQRNVRFLHGAAAAAMGRFEGSQGVRSAIRRRAGGQNSGSDSKSSPFTSRNPPSGSVAENPLCSGASVHYQQQRQQLAGDLGPPRLLQAPEEKRKSKLLSAAPPPQPPVAAHSEEPPKREDPVFQSFVQRQLQLLHAAALCRCARLLNFLLPQGAAAAAGDDERGLDGSSPASCMSSTWRPVQLQQLYARERSRSDEEAFLFFLRSLLLCQDDAVCPQAGAAPAFLLYSKEETAAALAAAAQLQLLPLRLLCCFYQIFAYIFALQQLQRQHMWGDEESSVDIEEVFIRVTDYSGGAAGTGEAEAPLTWEVRTERRERGGLQLLQLLQHSMSQAASLDAALRCTLASRGNKNPALKRLAETIGPIGEGEMASQQRLRRQQSLKPVANLLEVPVTPGDCGGETSEFSEGKFERLSLCCCPRAVSA